MEKKNCKFPKKWKGSSWRVRVSFSDYYCSFTQWKEKHAVAPHPIRFLASREGMVFSLSSIEGQIEAVACWIGWITSNAEQGSSWRGCHGGGRAPRALKHREQREAANRGSPRQRLTPRVNNKTNRLGGRGMRERRWERERATVWWERGRAREQWRSYHVVKINNTALWQNIWRPRGNKKNKNTGTKKKKIEKSTYKPGKIQPWQESVRSWINVYGQGYECRHSTAKTAITLKIDELLSKYKYI